MRKVVPRTAVARYRRERGSAPRETYLANATNQVKILVPGHQPMVALLGQRDAFLKLIESAFDCEILVRGNEITITGPPAEAERVGSIFEELLTLLERGNELSDSAVGQAIADDQGRQRRRRRPAARERGARRQAPHGSWQGHHAEDDRAEALRRRDPLVNRHVRDRSGGHRQDLPRRRHGGARAAGASGLAAHPHAAGRRGRRAPRIPARHAVREDRPIHASALRRAVRDDGRRHAAAG